MEEKEKKQENKQLTYDELKQAAGNLDQRYQKLLAEYQKAVQLLNNRDFDYMSFFLQMLFKVMDHAELYTDEFTKWTSGNIQNILTSFAANLQKSGEQEVKKEQKAEA